jgi:hypothetical protein
LSLFNSIFTAPLVCGGAGGTAPEGKRVVLQGGLSPKHNTNVTEGLLPRILWVRVRSVGFNPELVGIAHDTELQLARADDRHQITARLLENVLALGDNLVAPTLRTQGLGRSYPLHAASGTLDL